MQIPFLTFEEYETYQKNINEFYAEYVIGHKRERTPMRLRVAGTRANGLKIDLASDVTILDNKTNIETSSRDKVVFISLLWYSLTGILPEVTTLGEIKKATHEEINNMRDSINTMNDDLKNKGWLQGRKQRGDYSTDH